MLKKLLVGLCPLLAVMAVAATPSLAYQYEHVYCSQNMGVGGTCPGNGGSSEWAHLELNLANAGGQSHATCVDDYYSSGGYTEQHCMYYAGENAVQFSSGQYGYPRAWNGGTVEHFVYAEEYGYHT